MGRDRHETVAPDAAPASPASWRRLFARWAGEPLAGEEAAAFAAETAERDIRRVRVLAPLMLLLHVAHILLYRSAGGDVSPEIARWQQHVVAVHAATLPLTVAIIAVAFGRPRSWVGRRIVPVAAAAYLVHGALATGVDQIAMANVAAFTGYALGIAVICSYPFRTCAWMYGLAAAVLAFMLFEFQQDPAVRMSNLLNALTVVTMSVALSVLLHGGRRREFRQRRIIARQRDELSGLNASLERRVDEQVAEIVRRAEEVSQLNAQLRSQIRARSGELQAALARLAAQREQDDMLKPGSLLGDRFEIAGRIGSGGMGVVYSGSDRLTGSTVAIKVIRPGSAVELDAMRRFLGEAGAVASIEHPAVVRMIHVDISEDGFLYQAQEFVSGRTLEQQLDDGPWPQAPAARLGAVLCDALAAAHARGVIHRDVKPANVMLVREAPGLKLLDFGLARLFDDAAREARDRTGSRLVVGTPAYMAPEQVIAGEVTDKADVYAVGVLLFQLLSGRLAFEVEGASGIMMKHVSTAAPDVRSLQADVGPELAALVAACLGKDGAARPSAAELGLMLSRLADEGGAPPLEDLVRDRLDAAARPGPEPRTTGSIARRMRGLASAGLTGAPAAAFLRWFAA